MQIRVLGGDGGVAVGFQTTSFLVNENILIDAGSCATSLSTEEQDKIDHVFISHCHLDHVKDLCFLADNVFSTRTTSVQVHASQKNINILKKYLFNNKIWPDFSKLSNGNCKILEWVPFKKKVSIGGIDVLIYDVNHPVPANGFMLGDGASSVLISGDTGPTESIWRAANKSSNLKAIFTEIAFPNGEGHVAEAAGHFTPGTFAREYRKIKKNVPIYIYHLKPTFYNALKEQIDDLGLPNLRYVTLGAKHEF
jgi:cAMP phosphodiesterase